MIACSKVMRGEKSVHVDKKAGPLFVWNITSRCNLRCAHCYRESVPGENGLELSDAKCIELVSEIKGLNPPIVLLTGGEPLLRKNIFDIIKECKTLGVRVGLSTNGTLIDKQMAERILKAGVDYVGISIDGNAASHDKFRRMEGASDVSWQGIKLLNERGVKTGVRFTLTKANSGELMEIFDKAVKNGTKRFCLYHLVYAGRGSKDQDMTVQAKRKILSEFFAKVKELTRTAPDIDVLTTDNPADGVFMLKVMGGSNLSDSCVKAHGGCSAGERVVYLDSTGDVYPCQFLREHSLGNVLQEKLSDIWAGEQNAFLKLLRNKKDLLEGKCGVCAHKSICGGCRARAKAYHGSLWAEDPACYLEQSEITDVVQNTY